MSAKLARRSNREIGKSLALGSERVVCIGRLHYLVKSKSESGWHCIDLEPVDGQDGGCTCTSFRTRGECRHMAAICLHLGLDPPY